MVCLKCGQELNDGVKFCTKCGIRFSSWGLNNLMLIYLPIILVLIGIVIYVCLRYFGFSNESNNWARIVGRFSWWSIHEFIFFSGLILAFVSMYKNKNKITLITGIIGSLFYPVLTLFYILG